MLPTTVLFQFLSTYPSQKIEKIPHLTLNIKLFPHNMEIITNFINSTDDTKLIKQIATECKEHLDFLQHMSKPVGNTAIQHIVEQIRKSTDADEMKALIAQCNYTIENIKDERKRVEQERYSQQILEFLQNHVDVGEKETDKLEELLASFKLDSATFHMTQSNYDEFYDVSFSLDGVEISFKTQRGETGGDIDMMLGNARIRDFDVFDGKCIRDDDMKYFKQYAKSANVKVKNYLSLIYNIWDCMTEGECFRDICKFIRYDEEHGRGFTPTDSSASSRSSSMSY
jgi:hypothetical protein